jgi:hypothetical protein
VPPFVSRFAPLALACVTASCGVEPKPAAVEPGAHPPPRAVAATAEPFRFFSPGSFWNTEVPSNAQLDPESTQIVKVFDAEIADGLATGGRPKTTIETSNYSVPVYTVAAGQPTVRVRLLESPSLGPSATALREAWSAVPLPADAQPAAGGDKHLVVWQPSTNKMWEFWRLAKDMEGWYATWGGAMEKVPSNRGVYGSDAWPGASKHWAGWASSLSLVGGLITLEDLERGVVNHALLMAIPNVRAGVYSLPAQQDDGTSAEPYSLPEGAHLRLDPTLDLASLHLPRLTMMIAEAAQRYGIYVGAKGVNIAFYGQDPTPTGTNPYTAPGGYFEGKKPEELIATFPWNHLQLLPMRLYRNDGRPLHGEAQRSRRSPCLPHRRTCGPHRSCRRPRSRICKRHHHVRRGP